MKRMICLVICLLIIVSLSSCKQYRGEQVSLYTVAVNSIFGISGVMTDGEWRGDAEIDIVETDVHGRALFFYSERLGMGPELDYDMAFVIMQKSDDAYAYFYRNECYLPYFATSNDYETALEQVDPAAIEDLKQRNDWGLALDEEKCAKAELVTSKPEGKVAISKKDIDEVAYPHIKANGYEGTDESTCRFLRYCSTDAYGRELYYAYGMSRDEDENGETVWGDFDYAVIVNADGTFSESPIVWIKDPTQSYELIKVLKEQNNWDQPQ